MPTPSNRTPLRVARGTYSNLNSSVSDIQEGEICYATDQNKLYVKEGSSLESTQATVDPDTAVTDAAQTFTAGQRGEVTAITFASEMEPNFNDSNNFSVTLTGNARMKNPTNQVAGQSGSIFITQDGTGSRTLSWGNSGGTSNWHWSGGTIPTLSTAANTKDRIDYVVAATGVIHAVATLNVSANTP
jgi:hypothetical protein